MKRRIKQILAVLLTVFVIATLIIFCLRHYETKEYKRKGNELITKVENYKQTHGKLPESVNDICLTEEMMYLTEEMGKGPYYKKIDDTTYIVYFSIGFNNAFTYYSTKGEWEYRF